MRIGIRLAVSILVLTFILVSALGVHLLWWRTTEQTSRTLAATINEQIVSAVSDQLQSITSEGMSAFTAVRTLLIRHVLDTRDANKLEFVFLSQLQSQQTISWVAFGRPDGSLFAAHKAGDAAVEMMQIPEGQTRRRIERFQWIEGDFQFEENSFDETSYSLKEQEWFRNAIESEGPQWFNLTSLPGGERLAVAFAGPIDVDGTREGVLGIIIELTRVSRYLSQLATGKSAGAFILDRKGGIVASPDAEADEVTPLKANHPFLPIAMRALTEAGAGYEPDKAEVNRSQVNWNGEVYEVVLNPLSISGWSLATVVPESMFLGPVQKTIRQLVMGLVVLIAIAGLLSAWLAQRLIAAPLVRVVGEIKHVERFELDRVQRHSSHLAELDEVSRSISDMAGGLSAFKKYIPADLVKSLLSEGIEPKPGGTTRPMTVLFADIAGFTRLSERLGEQIFPLLSRYLEAMSGEITSHRGTIDKFIGDAVMAFWGAPSLNSDHAFDCCAAALACQRVVRSLDIADENGAPLRFRIGINSGDMLVGNIGSEVRLNYTVIGDVVNVASRLEAANKQYGSEIIIGQETHRLAGNRVHARELDQLAVYGRIEALKIYELVGLVGIDEDPSHWMKPYEQGLAAYRARDFRGAIGKFEDASQARTADEPSARMIERCKTFLATPPDASWNGLTIAQSK